MENFMNTLVEALVPIAVDVIVGVVGIIFALLLGQLKKIAFLRHTTDALEALQEAVVTVVYANQQALVDGWKEAAADGKLTPEEINVLKARTLERVKAAIGPSVEAVIAAAGIDVDQLILDSAEAVVREIKEADAK